MDRLQFGRGEEGSPQHLLCLQCKIYIVSEQNSFIS